MDEGRAKQNEEDRALDLIWRALYAADGRTAFCRRCSTTRPFHRVRKRRAYACDRCGGQIHPGARTPFSGSPIALSRWLAALSMILQSSTRPTAGRIAEHLGVSYRTAWGMRRRIERSLAGDGLPQALLDKLSPSWTAAPAVDAGHRPESSTPERRICEAACRVMADKGPADTRVADIAAAAGLSSASIHYHFRSKDEVLLAAFRWACTQSNRALQSLAEQTLEPHEHVRRLTELCVPVEGTARDEYVLWLEVWSRARNHPDFLEESKRMSHIWYEGVYQIFESGVKCGSFSPVAPLDEVCRRFLALAESLSYRATVGYQEMASQEAQMMLTRFTAEQLGIARDVRGAPTTRG
jgi:AcrR family transcriptional regulator